jgi:hypothetical protein
MILIRSLVLVLCLGLLFSKLSNAQDELSTPNLINQTTWEGCYVLQPTRTWAGYSGGWCPNVGADGSGITFGYAQSTLAQTIAVNKALELSGVNLQVTGYNYSWTVKNSNINNNQAGWAGGVDPLTFRVGLYSSSGSLLESDLYDYGYSIMQWTKFSGSRTYASPYQAVTLGKLNLSISSYDVGYWAGYYGPEVSDVNLSLRYTQVVQANKPVLAAPTAITYTAPITVTPTDTTKTGETTVSIGGVDLSTSGTIMVPDGIPQVVKDSVVKEEKPKSNLTNILNTIKRVQDADKATQTMVVQAAQQQVANSLFASQQTLTTTEFSSNNTATNPLAVSAAQKAAAYFTQEVQLQPIAVQARVDNSLVNSYSEQPVLDTQAALQQTNGVKRAADSNELAGSTDIKSLAAIPQGYAAYTAAVIPDAKFYTSKEIYGGQQNVDNIRNLRGLGSDQKHLLMIQSQYR